jgi:DNA-binding response OmpR family regulator
MARILIVEDDALIRHAFLTLLRSEGHRVVAAPTAHAAVQAATAEMPELVLLDVGLPDADGIECARTLRQLGVQSPIIFLTAYGSADFVARAIEQKAYAYLVKPITGDQLVPLVRTALSTAQLERSKEDKLVSALADSRDISAAVGMLAERHRWTIDQAFAALRLRARSEERRIVDVAVQIIGRSR